MASTTVVVTDNRRKQRDDGSNELMRLGWAIKLPFALMCYVMAHVSCLLPNCDDPIGSPGAGR